MQPPPRGRGARSEQTTTERELVKAAVDGQASRLVYSNRAEAYSKANTLRSIGGSHIRILTDKSDPNAIIIGPVA